MLYRRRFIVVAAAVAAAPAAALEPPMIVRRPAERGARISGPPIRRPASDADRRLRLSHLHTGERLDVVWTDGAEIVADAKAELDWFLRDWRTDETRRIDPAVLEQLNAIARALGIEARFEIVSGYRSLATNEMLRRAGGGVARRSMHLAGKALDVRPVGASLRDVHRAAVGLRAGGVGLYTRSNFIHLDSGRVRQWGA